MKKSTIKPSKNGLKARKGLQATASLKSTAWLAIDRPLKAKKRLPGIGRRKKKEVQSTGKWRRAYLGIGKPCEIGLVLDSFGHSDLSGVLARAYHRDIMMCPQSALSGLENCLRVATGLHERQKRSAAGGNRTALCDPRNLMRSCGPCNTWIEDNPLCARTLGLSVRAWEDPATVPIYGVS